MIGSVFFPFCTLFQCELRRYANWSLILQNNGAVVLSVDATAHPGELRESHLPRYLLNKEVYQLPDPRSLYKIICTFMYKKKNNFLFYRVLK